ARGPSDTLDREVACMLLAPSSARDRLTAGMYLPKSTREPLGRLEDAMQRLIATDVTGRKFADATRVRVATGRTFDERLESAVAAGALTEAEAEELRDADRARRDALAVDDFASL